MGPMLTEESFLVVVDYYSRYYEVVISHSTTTEKIVDALSSIFARFGFPHSLKLDNGPQFLRNVQEFSSGELHWTQNFTTVMTAGERRGGAPEQNPTEGA